ncbi:MAG: lysophospholipid acyltransferase family protein [Dehalococcoidia bacterium]
MRHIPLAHTARQSDNDLVEVQPHRWALSFWARAYRRLAKRWDIDWHIRAFCRPFTVEGRENLAQLGNPALIIANHTSHFDAVVALSVLPERLQRRTAIVAAADRMYRERIKGMLHSLRYNAFPITRGGGREALAYSQWLLGNGWSLLIFPEGKRSRTGDLLPFHPGPAILALGQRVPVAPLYIRGAIDILPAGQHRSKPAPVHVNIGRPLWFAEGTPVADARQAMEDAVRSLMPGASTEDEARELVLAHRA